MSGQRGLPTPIPPLWWECGTPERSPDTPSLSHASWRDDECHAVQAGIAVGRVVGIHRRVVHPWFLRRPGARKLTRRAGIRQRQGAGLRAVALHHGCHLDRVRVPHATWREWTASHHGDIGLDGHRLGGAVERDMGRRGLHIDDEPRQVKQPGIAPRYVFPRHHPLGG